MSWTNSCESRTGLPPAVDTLASRPVVGSPELPCPRQIRMRLEADEHGPLLILAG
jgi:hypothetical protein